VTWEGDEAVEECSDDDEETVVERRNAILNAHRKKPELKIEVEESDDGPSSEDEYVDYKLGKKKSADRVCSDILEILSICLIHFIFFSVVVVSFLPDRTLTQPTRLEDGALAALKVHHHQSHMVI
jgi:hypothetical protein